MNICIRRGKTFFMSLMIYARAAFEVTKCDMSAIKDTDHYNMARTTLADRMYGMSVKHGRPTTLPKNAVQNVFECIKKYRSQDCTGLHLNKPECL